MPVIALVNVIPGAIGGSAYTTAGAPTAGTTEVQTLTIGGTPDGGTMSFIHEGVTSAPVTWTDVDATLIADVDAALEALPTIGTGGITAADGTLTSGIGTITLTFALTNTLKNMGAITAVNNLTGTAPTAVITTTTPGIDASGRSAAKGALLTDISNGKLYITTTTNPPTWVVVGSQS